MTKERKSESIHGTSEMVEKYQGEEEATGVITTATPLPLLEQYPYADPYDLSTKYQEENNLDPITTSTTALPTLLENYLDLKDDETINNSYTMAESMPQINHLSNKTKTIQRGNSSTTLIGTNLSAQNLSKAQTTEKEFPVSVFNNQNSKRDDLQASVINHEDPEYQGASSDGNKQNIHFWSSTKQHESQKSGNKKYDVKDDDDDDTFEEVEQSPESSDVAGKEDQNNSTKESHDTPINNTQDDSHERKVSAYDMDNDTVIKNVLKPGGINEGVSSEMNIADSSNIGNFQIPVISQQISIAQSMTETDQETKDQNTIQSTKLDPQLLDQKPSKIVQSIKEEESKEKTQNPQSLQLNQEDSSNKDQTTDTSTMIGSDQCDDSIESAGSNSYQGQQPHHCLFYSEFFNACQKGNKYYPKYQINKELKCKSRQYQPICEYKIDSSQSNNNNILLLCDMKDCMRSTLKVGLFSKETGHFVYQKVDKTDALITLIETERRKYNRFAPFVFLNCKVRFPGKNKIRQILTFPHRSELEPSKRPDIDNHQRSILQNINIVVIDSLSRQHFYRVLTNTAKALKTINHRSNLLTRALDFKGMQSLAPFTYVNIHALMNGTIDITNQKKTGSSTRRNYPIQALFSAFKMRGYKTLLQEDSCWHDKWGSLLTGNEKLRSPINKKELWNDVLKTVHRWGVDDLGLTHMTCESLKKYGMTSLFDTHKMLCLNGRSISSYFIDYLISHGDDNQPNDHTGTPNDRAGPSITYTHINFGHEKTGRRIRALDDDLSRLINKLKAKDNTITFLMSDHGGKQSAYSINTIPGRYEVYDSLLFTIIPTSLETTLGGETFKDFLANQNSLVTVLDVRDTIIKLLELDGIQPDSKHSRSLFSTSLADRKDCHEVGIRKYALCKCLSDINLITPDDAKYKDFLLWLGEFAVGYLNNKISESLDKSGTSDTARCMLIEAQELRLVIEEQSALGVIYTFDVLTGKQNGESNDIFNFRISYNSKIPDAASTSSNTSNTRLMEIQTWNRISMYQRYSHCHGKTPLDMCICTGNSRFLQAANHTYVVSTRKQFGKKVTESSMVNQVECMMLLERYNGNVVTFEALNLCSKQVRLVFGVKTLLSWRVNQGLPVELVVRPSRLMFVATFLKWTGTDVLNEKIQPTVLTFWE